MGFQRETASRGTLAMYTSVCSPRFHGITTQTVSDCVCCCVRVYHIRDNTYSTLDRRRDHNHQLGHLYFRNIISFISTSLVLMRYQVTKIQPATDPNVERRSVGDGDREAG